MTDWLSQLQEKLDGKRNQRAALGDQIAALDRDIVALETLIESEERELSGQETPIEYSAPSSEVPLQEIQGYLDDLKPGPTGTAVRLVYEHRNTGLTIDDIFGELHSRQPGIKRRHVHKIVTRQVSETKRFKMERGRYFPNENFRAVSSALTS